MVRVNLNMSFTTTAGRTRNVNVPDPDVNINAGIIGDAAAAIIESDIFDTTNHGPLVSLRRAELVTTQRNTLF